MSTKTSMEMASGIYFDLDEPDHTKVRASDIAHHLSMINRFTGALNRPLSVAEHSINVMLLLVADNKFAKAHAVLHDGHEAYMGDIGTPQVRAVRRCIERIYTWDVRPESPIKELKHDVDGAIFQAFGLERPTDDVKAAIRHADLQMLAIERLLLKHGDPDPAYWPELPEISECALTLWHHRLQWGEQQQNRHGMLFWRDLMIEHMLQLHREGVLPKLPMDTMAEVVTRTPGGLAAVAPAGEA